MFLLSLRLVNCNDMVNRMNTVAKGDVFENMVFSKMKELLESEMLGLSPKHSRIFQKKAYLGKTGNKIIFDIAIESYHPDSEECSTLTLIECKDYKSPIQVDKLRSFASSIEDVGGNKGYFITTSNFQIGAINHAKSCKIGLAKFNMQRLDIENWILRRVSYLSHQKRQAIQTELSCSNVSPQNSFIAICGYDYYTNFLDFISEQLIGKPCKININYIADEVIKSRALGLINKMQYKVNTPITTDFLLEIVSKELKVKLIQNQPLFSGELGMCNFSQKTISISQDLEYDSPRWRFTLAHEIGHYILHENICSENMIATISDDEISLTSAINDTSLSRLEIQANKFASFILIPEDLFKEKYAIKHKELGITKFPLLYLDAQPCNIYNCMRVLSYLGSFFNVSKEVVKIKLKELSLLRVNESTKSLRDIIG